MARDYTKYEVEGIEGVFGKGKLVLAVVQDYCSKNECTFDELKAVFPDEAQAGNTGVFGTLDEAKEIAKKRARHYVKDPIKLSDTKIAVSNQWGDNLPLFIETAKGLGYDISAAGKTSNDATDNKSNEQSEESSNEEFSDQSFNTVEGITMIFRSMLSLDGEFTDDEAVKLVELVTPYVEYVGEELESVVTNALKIYNSNTFEQNFELVTSFSAIISERYSREICLKICKDLATLAWADGELHENESKYWSHILKAMGVSADEANAAIASENTEGDEAMAVEEDNKTTLADYGLSREFGHALDDLPDEKYNDKDITALAKKYNEDVEAALTYAKSAYGWMWSESNEDASTQQQNDENSFTTIPNHWGPEHVIVVPIRHCMVADGVVNQMEKNAMAHFFENFGDIGEASSYVWDSTDDEIMQIHGDGNYGELLVDSAIYLKEHLDNDQLSKLIWYMATIVSEDDVIQYPEFATLKFYFDQWFPDALESYMEKFKNAGMTVITSPDN